MVATPLLVKFVLANAAFQPTSVSCERLFNKDKLVFGETQKRLKNDRAEALVFLESHLRNRMNPEKFRLCHDCPKPPTMAVITDLPARTRNTFKNCSC